jgi:hypothetical protein
MSGSIASKAIVLSSLVAFPLFGGTPAVAQCTDLECNLAQLKSLTPEERSRLNALLTRELRKMRTPAQVGPRTLAALPEPVAEVPRAQTALAAKGLAAETKEEPRFSQHLRYYLRKDFEDITIFSGPALTSSDDAVGAEFSLTRDRISGDTAWSADGIVAAAYSYVQEQTGTPFIGVALGGFFGATREMHSKNLADNVDVKKFGVSGEVGFKNPIFTNRSDYFRGTLGGKRDDISDTDILHGKLEWLPTWAWDGRRVYLGALGLTYNFTPEFLVQYDRAAGTGKLSAFSGRAEALRVGPEAVLWLKLEPPVNFLQDFFRATSARLVYHSWVEVYSNRSGSWLDTSLVHNLDPDGFVALTLSYRRGQNEDTGARTDLYKASLSAKLCADIYSKDPC